jgi:hypothetical protein
MLQRLLFDHFYQWMAHIFHVPVPACFIIIFFEREDAKHEIDALFHFLNAVLFPGPYLRGNIEDHGKPLLLRPFGDAEVKAGIIDQYNYIGLISEDILFTEFYILKNGRQVFNHFRKTHESKVAVVFHQRGPGHLHQVATPAADGCRRIFGKQLFYQVAAMQVATCFAGDDVVFHWGAS